MIKQFIVFLLICLFLALGFFKTDQLITQANNIVDLVNQEPVNKTYISDELDHLKTFYLMKTGLGYYQARYLSQKNTAGDEAERIWKKDLWGWRLPLVFYFWKIIANNGAGIFLGFIILSITSLICSYFIALKFVNRRLAILVPVILFPYFINAIRTTSFLFIEWWALFFFIFGLSFFYYQRFNIATVFFSMAVLSREHYIIPFILMLLLSIYYKKTKKQFIIPIILFVLMLVIHFHQVSSLVTLGKSSTDFRRLSIGGKNLILATLAFSTNSYILVDYRPVLIWLILALIGIGLLHIQSKKNYYLHIALASFFPLFLCFNFMGNSIWEAYWGILYAPITGIFSITIFKALNVK